MPFDAIPGTPDETRPTDSGFISDQQTQADAFLTALHAINRHIRRGQSSATSHSGDEMPPITRTQWLILRTLNRGGGSSIGALAERLEVRPSTMSQMIDRLELAELVYRAPAEHDARTRIVRLTDAGEDIFRRMRDSRVGLLVSPFEQLTPAERTTLVDLMTRLASHVTRRREVIPDAPAPNGSHEGGDTHG